MEVGGRLSAQERAVLEFERDWWRHRVSRTKAEAIRVQLGLSTSRYYAVLAGLLDSPAALSHDPLLVRRLRRRRSDSRRLRFLGEGARHRQPH